MFVMSPPAHNNIMAVMDINLAPLGGSGSRGGWSFSVTGHKKNLRASASISTGSSSGSGSDSDSGNDRSSSGSCSEQDNIVTVSDESL